MGISDFMNSWENMKNQQLQRQSLIAQMANDPVIRAALPYMPALQKVMGIDPSKMGGVGGATGGDQGGGAPGMGGTLDVSNLPQGSQLLAPGGTPETSTDVGAGSALSGGGGGGGILSRYLGMGGGGGATGGATGGTPAVHGQAGQLQLQPAVAQTTKGGTPQSQGAARAAAFTGGPGGGGPPGMAGAPGAPGGGGPTMAGGGGANEYGVPGVPAAMMNPPTVSGMPPRVLTAKDIPILDFYRKMALMHGIGGGGGGFGGMLPSGYHVDMTTGDVKTDFAPGKMEGVPAGTLHQQGGGVDQGQPQGAPGMGQQGVSGAPGAQQVGQEPLPPLPGTPGTPGPELPPGANVIGRHPTQGGLGAGTINGRPVSPAANTYANDPATQQALTTLGLSVPKSPGLQSSGGGTARGGEPIITPQTRTSGNVTTYEQPEDMKPEYYALARLAAKDPAIRQYLHDEGSYGAVIAHHPELAKPIEDDMTSEAATRGAVGQVTKDQLSKLATVRMQADSLRSYLNSDFDRITAQYLPMGGKGIAGGIKGYGKAKANMLGTAIKSYAGDTAEDVGKLQEIRMHIIGLIQSMNEGVKQGGLRITTPEIELFGEPLKAIASGGVTYQKAQAIKNQILRELDNSEKSAQKEYGFALPRTPTGAQ